MHTPKDLKDHDYVKGVKSVIKQFEQTRKMMKKFAGGSGRGMMRGLGLGS